MIRRAFTMRLKPDSSTEYKYHHDNIWPELVAEIERSGIASITTFQRDLDLFLVSEIEDVAAWDRLWNSEIHKRWAEVMQPLMHLRDDGIVDAGELVEVFHLTTNGTGNGELSDVVAEGKFTLGELEETSESPLASAAPHHIGGNGFSSEVADGALAELIAEASADPAPAAPVEPAAEPAAQSAAPPAAAPARKKRVRPKKPARKPSRKKKPARKSRRKPTGKRPAAAAKKSKKKSRKKAATKKKKTAARKSNRKKAAEKKAARKRARK